MLGGIARPSVELPLRFDKKEKESGQKEETKKGPTSDPSQNNLSFKISNL